MIEKIRRWLASKDEIESGSCNRYGHNWENLGVSGYHTHGVPHFGMGDSFKVERQDRYKCTKCGKVKFEKRKVGRIKVNKKTDELTVVQ